MPSEMIGVTKRIYILSAGVYRRLANNNKHICYTCGKPIKIGSKVLSIKRRGSTMYKIRHYECAKRVNIV